MIEVVESVHKELIGTTSNNVKYYPLFVIGISYDYKDPFDKFGKKIHFFSLMVMNIRMVCWHSTQI